jgi:hypothetical protein
MISRTADIWELLRLTVERLASELLTRDELTRSKLKGF